METKKEEVLDCIAEKFIAMGTKTIDSKNRITLSEKILKLTFNRVKTEEFKVFFSAEGDILLRPMVSIPAREAWIYRNPKVLKQIRQGLAEAKEKRVHRAEDLNGFFENL